MSDLDLRLLQGSHLLKQTTVEIHSSEQVFPNIASNRLVAWRQPMERPKNKDFDVVIS